MEQEVLQEKQSCSVLLSRVDKKHKSNKYVDELQQATTSKNNMEQTENNNIEQNISTIRKTVLTYDHYVSNTVLNNDSNKKMVSYNQQVDNDYKNCKDNESVMTLEVQNYIQSQEENCVRSIVNGNTSLSREFSALRKSVGDSKVLSEFFTDSDTKLRSKDESIEDNMNNSRLQQKKRKNRKNMSVKAKKNEQLLYPRHSRAKCSLTKHKNISFNCFHSQSSISYSEQIALKNMNRRSNLRSNNLEDVYEDNDIKSSILHDQPNSIRISDEKFNVNKEIVSKIKKKSLNLYYNYKCNSNDNCISCIECIGNRLETVWQPPPQPGWDPFCWKCHEAGNLMPCSKCIRCFHLKCLKIPKYDSKVSSGVWVCPECTVVDNIITNPKRRRRSNLRQDLLNQLLSFVLKRMQNMKRELPSIQEIFGNLKKFFVNPVTFESLSKKILNNEFRCGEEFVNESKWILHNVAIIEGKTMEGLKQTANAKSIVKCCRQEINEIQICPECYLNANTRSDWFVEVCNQPHLLVWAKLKGFPYWPAKVMGTGQGSFVNVRFFGEHDRAYVPVKDCFIFSEQNPNTQTNKRSRELADCMKEVYVHIENVKNKFGKFCFSPFKTPYDPLDEINQLEQMMPGVTDYMNRHLTEFTMKPSLQYKIVKTADNNLSIIKKTGEYSENEDKLKPKSLFNSKYEVISKIPGNEKDEKVHSVILKRKSVDFSTLDKSERESENLILNKEVSQTKIRRSIDKNNEKKKLIEEHQNDEYENTRHLISKNIISPYANSIEKNQNILNNDNREIIQTHKLLISNDKEIDENKRNGRCSSTLYEAVLPFVEIRDKSFLKKNENTFNSYADNKILSHDTDLPTKLNTQPKKTSLLDHEQAVENYTLKHIDIKEERNLESESVYKISQQASKNNIHESVRYHNSYKSNKNISQYDNFENMEYIMSNSETNNSLTLCGQAKKSEPEVSPALTENVILECKNSLAQNVYNLTNKESLKALNENRLHYSSMVSIPAHNINSKLCEENSNISIAASYISSTSNNNSLDPSLNEKKKHTNGIKHSLEEGDNISNVENSNDKNKDGNGMSKTIQEEFKNSTEQILPHLAPKPNVCNAKFGKSIGPIHRALSKNAQKLTDFFINVMESTLNEISPGDDAVNLQATITLLQLQLERVKSKYDEEIAKIKHNTEQLISEMQCNLEEEKKNLSDEIKRQCDLERQRCIEETKMKQWCANCGIEAQFYCCWNTSYCDYPCQQLHWSRHAAYCAQAKKLITEPFNMSDVGSTTKEKGANIMSTVGHSCSSWETNNQPSLVKAMKNFTNTPTSSAAHSIHSDQQRFSSVQTIASSYNSSTGYYINSITPTSSSASIECDFSDFSHN